jgi:hypothetical protein
LPGIFFFYSSKKMRDRKKMLWILVDPVVAPGAGGRVFWQTLLKFARQKKARIALWDVSEATLACDIPGELQKQLVFRFDCSQCDVTGRKDIQIARDRHMGENECILVDLNLERVRFEQALCCYPVQGNGLERCLTYLHLRVAQQKKKSMNAAVGE